jgi:hypothetical protein
MSKNKQRVQIDLDASVARALTSPPTGNGKVGKHGLVRINVRIPADLKQQIQAEAYALTHHKRRGFQDLVAIFLDYGLKAYQSGELEVTLSEKVVDYQIVAKVQSSRSEDC